MSSPCVGYLPTWSLVDVSHYRRHPIGGVRVIRAATMTLAVSPPGIDDVPEDPCGVCDSDTAMSSPTSPEKTFLAGIPPAPTAARQSGSVVVGRARAGVWRWHRR